MVKKRALLRIANLKKNIIVFFSQMICAYEIDTVLTFDRGGVSGHANHTSLYNAMVFLSLENRLPAGKYFFVPPSLYMLPYAS